MTLSADMNQRDFFTVHQFTQDDDRLWQDSMHLEEHEPYRFSPIHPHHPSTSPSPSPRTLPPTTLTSTSDSLICSNENGPSPPSPSHPLSSSPFPPPSVPTVLSSRPLLLVRLTFPISSSSPLFTSSAGNAVNRSILFAATSTETAEGALEVLELLCRVWSVRRMSWRYVAASVRPAGLESAAASTT